MLRDRLQPSRRRPGNLLSMELLLVAPLLLILMLAMVEYGLYYMARELVVNAARDAARVAATGGTQEDIEQAVRLRLGSGPLGQVKIDVLDLEADDSSQPYQKAVAVVISLPAENAVPDLLRIIGFSVQNRSITAQTVLRKE